MKQKAPPLTGVVSFAASMIVAAGCSKKEEAPEATAEPAKPPEAEKKEGKTN